MNLMITILEGSKASFRYFNRNFDVNIYQMQKAMSHYGFPSKAAKSDVLSSITNILSAHSVHKNCLENTVSFKRYQCLYQFPKR